MTLAQCKPMRTFSYLSGIWWNCVEIDKIVSFRLGFTRVQQPVRSEWHIHDGGQLLSKNVPFWSVLAHIFETTGWDNITFESQGHIGIIHSFLDFDLRMTPCDLELFRGGASAGRPFSFNLKTLGEKVGYCQSLSSDFVLLGASYNVYWWVQSSKIFKMALNLKSQLFHSNLTTLRLLQ